MGLALVIDSLTIRLADVVEKCSSAADFGGGLGVAIFGVLIILVGSNCCEGGHFIEDDKGVLPGIVAVVLGLLVVFEKRREFGQDLKNHITIYSKNFLGVWAANKFGHLIAKPLATDIRDLAFHIADGTLGFFIDAKAKLRSEAKHTKDSQVVFVEALGRFANASYYIIMYVLDPAEGVR